MFGAKKDLCYHGAGNYQYDVHNNHSVQPTAQQLSGLPRCLIYRATLVIRTLAAPSSRLNVC